MLEDALLEQKIRIVVIGSANMDLVLPVERLARAGETISGGDPALFPAARARTRLVRGGSWAGGSR